MLRHCWLGHVTRKTVSEMTYNVSSGTLNSTIPYHTMPSDWLGIPVFLHQSNDSGKIISKMTYNTLSSGMFNPTMAVLTVLSVNRELANKDMQLTEIQDQLEAESCFSVSVRRIV